MAAHGSIPRVVRLTLAIAAPVILASCAWFPDRREPPYELVNAWGGQGADSGEFSDPNGIAVTGDRVFVADSRNHRIQVFTRAGEFIDQWPVPEEGRPMNLDTAGGRLYAADYWNDVIRVYALDSGDLLHSIGGPGEGPGRFRNPGGVAVGPDGHLFVADFANHRIQKLEPDGDFVRQWGATGEKGYIFGHREDDVVGGAEVDNEGTEWRIAPGFQYVTRRWVAEAAVELPLADDLPDTALRDDAFWHVGMRFQF